MTSEERAVVGEEKGGGREILVLPLQSHYFEYGSRAMEEITKGLEFTSRQDHIDRPYSVGVAGNEGNRPRRVGCAIDGKIDGTGL